MKKLALGALCIAGFLAACGGGDDGVTLVPDAMEIDGTTAAACNPIQPAGMQGCAAGQKCTHEFRRERPGHLNLAGNGNRRKCGLAREPCKR